MTVIVAVDFKQRRVWLDPRPVCLNFVVQKVTLEQAFFKYFDFLLLEIIPLMLHVSPFF